MQLMLLPKRDDGKLDCTFHNRLIKDMHHLASNTEDPWLPQQVKAVLVSN